MSLDVLRSQPFSDEAEKSLISCALYNPALLDEAIEKRLPEKFYHPANRLLMERLCEMRGAQKPIELPAVGQHLLDLQELDKIGGPAMLAELYDFVPTPAHWPYYRSIVHDKNLLRSIIGACTEGIQRAYEHNEDVLKLLDGVEQAVMALRPKDGSEASDAMSVHVMGIFEQIEARMTAGSSMSGPSTGFSWLDHMTKGLRPEIWYIGARPSEGKTSILLQFINAYIDRREPVGMFSLEMSRSLLNQRLVSMRSGVSLSRMFGGYLNREELAAVTRATQDIRKAHFYCDDRGGLTHPEIRAKARRWKREYGVRMIGVDFLQRMGIPESGKRNRNRADEHAENSTSLADAVKELQIPFIVLAQLNREMEKASRAPKMSDFEGCGRIEQDADLAMFLYRIKKANEQDVTRKVWWDIQKQRNGPTNRRLHLFREPMSAFDSNPIEEPKDDDAPHLPSSKGRGSRD